ncbi:MAG: hypothetical protein WA969_04640 [Candidatus Microthrix parvicella]
MGFDFTDTPMVTIPTDDVVDVCLVARVLVDWLQQANPEVLCDLTAYTGDEPDRFIDTFERTITRLHHWKDRT